MATDVPIRCECGLLRGVARGLSPSAGNRLVCYCDDCQSFAHALGQADAVLDANGGTEIFQTSPARLEITDGAEQLGCLRLTAGGMLRWHSVCCSTAIGNTLASGSLPFVGLIHTCMDHSEEHRARDVVLGPVRVRVHGRFARGDVSGLGAHPKVPPSMLFRIVPRTLAARLRGDQKRSPFFDATTGEPRATPRVLSEAELREVEAARDAR